MPGHAVPFQALAVQVVLLLLLLLLTLLLLVVVVVVVVVVPVYKKIVRSCHLRWVTTVSLLYSTLLLRSSRLSSFLPSTSSSSSTLFLIESIRACLDCDGWLSTREKKHQKCDGIIALQIIHLLSYLFCKILTYIVAHTANFRQLHTTELRKMIAAFFIVLAHGEFKTRLCGVWLKKVVHHWFCSAETSPNFCHNKIVVTVFSRTHAVSRTRCKIWLMLLLLTHMKCLHVFTWKVKALVFVFPVTHENNTNVRKAVTWMGDRW